MDYKVLDKQTQLSAVEARIRDIERQHLEVNLRVEAPSAGEGFTDNDKNQLDRLAASLEVLYKVRSDLQAQDVNPAAAPTQ